MNLHKLLSKATRHLTVSRAEYSKLLTILMKIFWSDWTSLSSLIQMMPNLRYFSLSNHHLFQVCAPTGAGKTNIAMIAVLHEVHTFSILRFSFFFYYTHCTCCFLLRSFSSIFISSCFLAPFLYLLVLVSWIKW